MFKETGRLTSNVETANKEVSANKRFVCSACNKNVIIKNVVFDAAYVCSYCGSTNIYESVI